VYRRVRGERRVLKNRLHRRAPNHAVGARLALLPELAPLVTTPLHEEIDPRS
jgi:hypothetical protein